MAHEREKELLKQLALEMEVYENLGNTDCREYEDLSDNYQTIAESILPLWDDEEE